MNGTIRRAVSPLVKRQVWRYFVGGKGYSSGAHARRVLAKRILGSQIASVVDHLAGEDLLGRKDRIQLVREVFGVLWPARCNSWGDPVEWFDRESWKSEIKGLMAEIEAAWESGEASIAAPDLKARYEECTGSKLPADAHSFWVRVEDVESANEIATNGMSMDYFKSYVIEKGWARELDCETPSGTHLPRCPRCGGETIRQEVIKRPYKCIDCTWGGDYA